MHIQTSAPEHAPQVGALAVACSVREDTPLCLDALEHVVPCVLLQFGFEVRVGLGAHEDALPCVSGRRPGYNTLVAIDQSHRLTIADIYQHA